MKYITIHFHLQKTNTPVTGSSEVQLDAQPVKNKENCLPDFDQVLNLNAADHSEDIVLCSDRSSHPSHFMASCEDNIAKAFSWNPSLNCNIFNKSPEQMFQKANTMISLLEEAIHNYSMSAFDSTYAASSFLHFDNNSVQCISGCKNMGKNSEERRTKVLKLQLELRKWKEKCKENQKGKENVKSSLSVNIVSHSSTKEQKTVEDNLKPIASAQDIKEISGAHREYNLYIKD
jgi:hypothetical protein